jgi:hypothetical protein
MTDARRLEMSSGVGERVLGYSARRMQTRRMRGSSRGPYKGTWEGVSTVAPLKLWMVLGASRGCGGCC